MSVREQLQSMAYQEVRYFADGLAWLACVFMQKLLDYSSQAIGRRQAAMSDKSEIEAIRAVKRYKNTILMGENGPSDYLTEASNGDWVQATDYDALRASSVDWADYAALEARIAQLEGALGDCIKYIELDSEVPDFVMRYKSALAAGKGE